MMIPSQSKQRRDHLNKNDVRLLHSVLKMNFVKDTF